VRVSLIFAIIVSFMLFTVFPLVYVLYFEEFLTCGRTDGRTDGQTDGQKDGQTDELIRVGLGNLWFLQVKGRMVPVCLSGCSKGEESWGEKVEGIIK